MIIMYVFFVYKHDKHNDTTNHNENEHDNKASFLLILFK